MTRYIDIDGTELTRPQWWTRFCQKGYGDPLRQEVGAKEVRMAWVGITFDGEENPGVWVIQVLDIDPNGKGSEAETPIWASTREKALAVYAEAIKRLQVQQHQKEIQCRN